jgi:hypothetical protein
MENNELTNYKFLIPLPSLKTKISESELSTIKRELLNRGIPIKIVERDTNVSSLPYSRSGIYVPENYLKESKKIIFEELGWGSWRNNEIHSPGLSALLKIVTGLLMFSVAALMFFSTNRSLAPIFEKIVECMFAIFFICIGIIFYKDRR